MFGGCYDKIRIDAGLGRSDESITYAKRSMVRQGSSDEVKWRSLMQNGVSLLAYISADARLLHVQVELKCSVINVFINKKPGC